MANALGVDLKPGTIVRVAAKWLNKPLPPMERRYFVAEDGFGMSARTSGRAISGFWHDTGVKDRIEGYMIDKIISEPGAEEATA